MSFCKKCGAQLNEGDRFCTECGAPVTSEAPANQQETTPAPARQEKKGKMSWGKLLGIALTATVVTIGINLWGTITGDGGGDGSSPYQPNILPAETKGDDVVPDAGQADVAQGFEAEDDVAQGLDASCGDDLEGIDGIIDLDDMSESDRAAYEERLFGSSSSSAESLDEAYTGTWVSTGLVVLNYRDIVDSTNGDLARLIDRNMAASDAVKFVVGNGRVKLWIGGKQNLSGRYSIRESGNITVVTDAGEQSVMWMYSPNRSTLYSYVYYVDDDGTEKASCIKYLRN